VNAPKLPNLTHCGLPGIDLVPVGMHACHFYSNREQLVGAVVPYIAAGLRANERCIWITAPPLPARKAEEALRAECDGVDGALAADALTIVDFDEWYASCEGLKGLDVVRLWLESEERALADGYKGLRITGNISFLEPGEWSDFVEYEKAVSARLTGRRIVALCSYPQAQARGHGLSDVLHAHHCAFERSDADWQVAATAPR